MWKMFGKPYIVPQLPEDIRASHLSVLRSSAQVGKAMLNGGCLPAL